MRISHDEITRWCASAMSAESPAGRPALMLFGSVARGDAHANSDTDVLLAVDGADLPAAGPIAGRIASAIGHSCFVTIHSFEQLKRMVEGGSVFFLHLQIEGIVLGDPTHRLRNLLASSNIIDFKLERDLLRQGSAVLYARDLSPSLAVTHRVAKHLLRRAAFLECAKRGHPAFATHKVSLELGDPRLLAMLGSGEGQDNRTFSMRCALADYVGVPSNVGETLNVLARQPYTSSLALDLLSGATVVAYGDTSAEESLTAA